MRAKSLMSFLVLEILALQGCGSNDAVEKYVEKLVVVLHAYQEQVSRKIEAEEDSYKYLANIQARALDEQVNESLWLERSERAGATAEDLMRTNNPLSRLGLRARLLEYGLQDFDQTRKLYESEREGQAQFLAGLESLEAETQRIQSLTAALRELTKSKGKLERLGELGDFAHAVDTEYTKLMCKDLSNQVEDLKKEIESLNKQKDATADEKKKGELETEVKNREAEKKRHENRKETKDCKE